MGAPENGLALDLSIRTGWAADGDADQNGVRPVAGVLDLRADPSLCRTIEADAFERIAALVQRFNPRWLAVEAPMIVLRDGVSNSATLDVLIGLKGVASALAGLFQIPFLAVASTTARKHFIGQGNLRSREAKQAVFDQAKRLGWRPRTTDESDAMAVWSWAKNERRVQALAAPLAGPLFNAPPGGYYPLPEDALEIPAFLDRRRRAREAA